MSKPYLTVSQQIQHLINKKSLIVTDVAYAEQKLTDIGYCSLIGGYKTPFINSMTRKYTSNTTFEDVFCLYQFDKGLRMLTFEYLNAVEEKIGQLISDAFCNHYGEKQSSYLDPHNYLPGPGNNSKVAGLIRILSHIANQDTDHDYIIHQRQKYGDVPLWETRKALTFGQLSKMYSVLQIQQKTYIANHYTNISVSNLTSFLSALTFFRNVSAHNERLYSFKVKQHDFPDTRLHKKLKIPQKGVQYIMGKSDYFGVVIALRYLLPSKDFLVFKRRLKSLFNSYSHSSQRLSQTDLLSLMGMPNNWETITRYKP